MNEKNELQEEENKGIATEMETVIENNEEEIVYDSAFKQFSYLFTSWPKFFESAKIKPYILVLILVIFLATIALPFVSNGYKELSINSQIELLQEIYENDMYDSIDKDSAIQMAIDGVEASFSPVRLIIAQAFGKLLSVLLTSVFVLLTVLILGSKNKNFKGVLAISLGMIVFSSFYDFFYYMIINFTNSLVDVTSLGILNPNANVMSTSFVLLNSISLLLIISLIYLYMAGVKYFNLSKAKSIVLTIVINIIPIVLSVGAVVVYNQMFGSLV